MEMKSEARLTTFEAISMIVGNSIGTGIIAVPYLATKNSMLDVVWMVALAYIVNVILHLIIAELSYTMAARSWSKVLKGNCSTAWPRRYSAGWSLSCMDWQSWLGSAGISMAAHRSSQTGVVCLWGRRRSACMDLLEAWSSWG